MDYNVGLSVVEGISNGLAPFTSPPKRNIGILMERERGVENKPYRIASLSDDRLYFGGYSTDGYGYVVVRNLFRNARTAPVVLYGVRIVGAASTAATIAATIASVNVSFTAAQFGEEDKGTWGNDLDVTFYSYDYKKKNKFYIEVYYKGKLVETFENVTCAGLQQDVNSNSMYVSCSFASEIATPSDTTGTGTVTCTTGSKTVTGVGTAFDTQLKVGSILKDNSGATVGVVAAIASATSLTLEENALVAITGAAFKFYLRYSQVLSLASGTYAAPVEADFYSSSGDTKTGLSALDGSPVNIIMCAEFNTLTMAQNLKSYCETVKKLGVCILPLNASEVTRAAYSAALQTSTESYIAAYDFWAKTSDESNGYVTVPGYGHILGASYLYNAYIQGDFIHIPPAGADAPFTDLVEGYPSQVTQEQLDYRTTEYTINSIKRIDKVGYFTMTSRTMSTDPLFHSIHTRLQAIYYKTVLEESMGWVIQKPNTPELKKQVVVALTLFFKQEYDNGALERSIPFSQAAVIVCDVTNNPLSGNRKNLKADVDYIPTETAEAFRIGLNRNDGILQITTS